MRWEANWASKRLLGRARCQVEAMFLEEKPHLRMLPLTGFRYFEQVVRTVSDDTALSGCEGRQLRGRDEKIETALLRSPFSG